MHLFYIWCVYLNRCTHLFLLIPIFIIMRLYVDTAILTETWYHGTPDSRGLKSGFERRMISVDYVRDLDGYRSVVEKLSEVEHGSTEYFKYLDMVPTFKSKFKFPKPVFVTDSYSVARTYADPKRAFDYQGAEEKVLEVEVSCNKIATIKAPGSRFRFIPVDVVRRGLSSGVGESDVNDVIEMFNYAVSGDKGIRTDTIAAIGNYLKFDCIDVEGVLDSYMGGNERSTVRMVLDPSKIKVSK